MARHKKEDPELDITTFMNLMIVLVPVLLLNMVVASTSILQIKLPAGAGANSDAPLENESIELIIRKDHLTLNFPAGVGFGQYPLVDGKYDYKKLSQGLQQLKQYFASKNKEKKDILILAESDTNYQTIVSTMDAVRSYKTVVVADVVDAELFPDISLGDAPLSASGSGVPEAAIPVEAAPVDAGGGQ